MVLSGDEARSSLGVTLVLSGLVDEGMVELDESLVAVCGGDVEDLSRYRAGAREASMSIHRCL